MRSMLFDAKDLRLLFMSNLDNIPIIMGFSSLRLFGGDDDESILSVA